MVSPRANAKLVPYHGPRMQCTLLIPDLLLPREIGTGHLVACHLA